VNRSIITALVAACAFGALAQPASAADSRQRHAIVSYAQLDLASEAGAETLYRRLERAAERVCGNADHRRTSLVERRAFNRCVDSTLETAISAINAPLVQERFAARRGGSHVASS
jgi:UrcA family protein